MILQDYEGKMVYFVGRAGNTLIASNGLLIKEPNNRWSINVVDGYSDHSSCISFVENEVDLTMSKNLPLIYLQG